MKLSDTQLVILNIACQRTDHRVLPLPANLKGGAAEKVIGSLITTGLVEEVQAELGDPVWRVPDRQFAAVARALRPILALSDNDELVRDTDGRISVRVEDRPVPIERLRANALAVVLVDA